MERRSLITVALAAIVSPVGFLASNATRAPSLVRIAVVAAVIFSTSVTLVWALTRRGIRAKRCAPATAVGMVCFTYVGLIQNRLDIPPVASGALGFLITAACVLTIVLALRKWQLFESIVLASLSAAVSGPILLATINQPARAAAPDGSDVVILFLDGYASSRSLQELYGVDNSGFEDSLRELAFEVVPTAAVGYSMTYASIASMLEMDYVVDIGHEADSVLRPDLYSRMQGDNAFVRVARERGYQYTHLESGWGGTRCGPLVDECVRAPFLEETVWNFMQRTALAPLMEIWFGHPFPRNGLDRLRSLADLDLDDSRPELVIVHALIPHPPLLVGDGCEVEFSGDLTGMNVGAPYYSETDLSRRRHAYATQLECTNRLVLEMIGNPSLSGAVFVIVGDHGPDSLGQLLTPVTEWTEAMVRERMTTLAAVRGCAGHPPNHTTNLLRWVANCAFDLDLPNLAPRQFLVPVTENHPDDEVVEVETG